MLLLIWCIGVTANVPEKKDSHNTDKDSFLIICNRKTIKSKADKKINYFKKPIPMVPHTVRSILTGWSL